MQCYSNHALSYFYLQGEWVKSQKNKRGPGERHGRQTTLPETMRGETESHYVLEFDQATRCYKLIDASGGHTWCSQPNEACQLLLGADGLAVKYMSTGRMVLCQHLLDGDTTGVSSAAAATVQAVVGSSAGNPGASPAA
jgi:hypothetical protein